MWKYFKNFNTLINYVVTKLEHASTMFVNLHFNYVGMQTIYKVVIVKDEGCKAHTNKGPTIPKWDTKQKLVVLVQALESEHSTNKRIGSL
jgi:hypothetical protein